MAVRSRPERPVLAAIERISDHCTPVRSIAQKDKAGPAKGQAGDRYFPPLRDNFCLHTVAHNCHGSHWRLA